MNKIVIKSTIVLFYCLVFLEAISIILYTILIKRTYDNNPQITYENPTLIKTVEFYFFTLIINLVLIVLSYACGINAINKQNVSSFNISIVSQFLSIPVIALNSYFNYDWLQLSRDSLWELIANWLTIAKGGVYLFNAILCLFIRSYFVKLSKAKDQIQSTIDDGLNLKGFYHCLSQGNSLSDKSRFSEHLNKYQCGVVKQDEANNDIYN